MSVAPFPFTYLTDAETRAELNRLDLEILATKRAFAWEIEKQRREPLPGFHHVERTYRRTLERLERYRRYGEDRLAARPSLRLVIDNTIPPGSVGAIERMHGVQ